MKKGTLVISSLLTLALAGASIAASAEPQPGHGHESGHSQQYKGHGMSEEGHDMMSYRLFERLGLSEEQRASIDAIREARAPELREKAKALYEASRDMRGYALSDDFDVNRARELATKRAGLQAELQVLRMTGFNEAWKVLTVEQKAKLADWRARHEERGDSMGRHPMPQHDMNRWHSDN